jgi:hypothetical protein
MTDDARWEEVARDLAKYKDMHGDFHVPSGYVSRQGAPQLRKWMLRQAHAEREGKMNDARRQRLLEIGYFVTTLEDAACGTVVIGKNAAVPPNPPSSKKKAPTSRRGETADDDGKPSAATPARKAPPVVFSAATGTPGRRTEEEAWNWRYEQVVHYKEEHGTAYPDFATHKLLRTWVNKQQDKWYEGKLNPDQIEKLRDLGVEGPPDKSSANADVDDEEEDDDTEDEEDNDVDGAGVATRSARKSKRHQELGDDGRPPTKKLKATAAAEAAAPEPSFLTCLYQAVTEKVSTFLFGAADADRAA